jgi:hypothetical protein
MKTRNGLVSNSSSSSFVVAFPKKPTKVEDVFQYMFSSRRGSRKIYDDYELSYIQISNNVFESLNDKKLKSVTVNQIADIFSNQYHFINGEWYPAIDKYHGSDLTLLQNLKQEIIKADTECLNLSAERTEILKRGPKNVPYAYTGGYYNYETKKLFTKTQINNYNKFVSALDKFETTDLEYIDYTKRYNHYSQHSYKSVQKARNKLAMADAVAFINDNKNRFIFIVTYGDDNRDGTVMEHADIFKNVPHVRISNH